MKSFGGRGSGVGVAKLVLGIILIALALAAWVVALSGVSVVRHERRYPRFERGTPSIYNTIDADFSWFVIAATAFGLIFSLFSLVGSGLSLGSMHSAGVGIMAVVTTLDIFQTRDWNYTRTQTFYGLDKKSELGRGIATAFAGFLMLSVFNALLIMVLGARARSPRHETDAYRTGNVHTNPAVGGATTHAPHAEV